MNSIFVAIRECGVLLLGCAFTALVAYLTDDGRPQPKMMPFANPLAALFIPILVCFVRSGFVQRPASEISRLRSIVYQFTIAFALILLLIFEIGVGLFVGAQDIPLKALVVVSGFGALYVCVFCLADAINHVPRAGTESEHDWR
ncbi:MAG: hypothetical protein AAF483_27545 [Planctomycetota bacterium]